MTAVPATSTPGVGIFGSSPPARWLATVLQDQGFRVEAIWARTSMEAEAAAQALNIPFHTSRVDDVLLRKDVGLVVILCPPSLHSQIAVKALGIGKHVLCGVPGGLSQGECLRMVQAAQYYPTLMAVLAYSLRFLPNMVTMRDMISRGYLGESVNLVDVRISCSSLLDTKYTWCCDSGMGGGVLSLLGSHVIDLLTFLQLGRVLRVHATLVTLTKTTDNIRGIRQITADDVAVLQLHLVAGTFVTITINSSLSGFMQEVTVCGTAGHLTARQGDLRGKKNGATKDEVFNLDVSENELGQQSSGLPSLHAAGLVRMVGELRDVFRGKLEGQQERTSVAATFGEGLYVQAVMEALRRSSESREWRKVELVQEEGGGQ
eukprot:GFUD01106421.1.p1 GENE.GFUD01106421.1~~GFUD01106421.1.p1  ORF type:complete len:375 (-),score=165.96 GFUD01106421.1:297-1421(-)